MVQLLWKKVAKVISDEIIKRVKKLEFIPVEAPPNNKTLEIAILNFSRNIFNLQSCIYKLFRLNNFVTNKRFNWERHPALEKFNWTFYVEKLPPQKSGLFGIWQ